MCTLACFQLKYIILELYKGCTLLLKFMQHLPEGPFIWPDLQQCTPFRVFIKEANFLPHSSPMRTKSTCCSSADTHKASVIFRPFSKHLWINQLYGGEQLY